MSIGETSHLLDRLRFFDGQRLFSSDLQAIDARHQTMRQLHNRTLHQAGIGYGLIVAGAKGDREVKISPGYAIDAEGREIILTESETEPAPPVNADSDGQSVFYDLTVSHRSADQLEDSQLRQGVCSQPGVIRLREQVQFCWVRLARSADGKLHPKDTDHARDILQQCKIRLARIEIRNCQIESVSAAVRHDVSTQGTRYIASGECELTKDTMIRQQEIPREHFAALIRVIRGSSTSDAGSGDDVEPASSKFALVTLLERIANTGTTLIRESKVSTECAGFTRSPSYTTTIRITPDQPIDLLTQAVGRLVVDMLSEIRETHPKHFILRHPIWIPNPVDAESAADAPAPKFSVAWTGIE